MTRALMLSWEYPPLVVGGLGRHVDALARGLAAAGHDVQIVTRGEEKDEILDEVVAGVHVRRAALDPLAIDFTTESLLAWSQASEHSMVRAALPLIREQRPDVIHAHDWLVAQTAATLVSLTGAPLVATMHATERGRHQGRLPAPLHRAIDSVERWLVQSSDAVIACSGFMRDEVSAQFDPLSVDMIPNGIDATRWRRMPAARRAARERFAGDGSLIAYAGRLVHEKGVQHLLSALPAVRRRHRGTRLVIAGTGPYEADLRDHARGVRVARAVDWLGFASDDDVVALFTAADVVVVPSMYEPFGIVALEAAAAGTPLVVAETGGLCDVLDAGLAAASFAPGEPAALAGALDRVLGDPARAQRIARRAMRTVTRDYGWSVVADRTAALYRRAGSGRSAR